MATNPTKNRLPLLALLLACVVTKPSFYPRHGLKGVRCREAFLALFEK
jgi:hypothetical protein